MSLVGKNVRSLHELYLLVYETMKSNILSIHGICEYIRDLRIEGEISREEYYLLINHFRLNRPNLDNHVEFYDASRDHNSYWFELGLSGYDVRLRFVEKMIEITKSK
jgi:hypothetical protein